MKRKSGKLLALMLAGIVSFTPAASGTTWNPAETVFAHSGRTDSGGGHRDNQNRSGLGNYHYHCGGYPAHLHENGVCPYTDGAASNSSSSGTSSAGSSASVSRNTVKKVQKKLNRLGYECGTPDGIMGSKTKRALKKFQKDCDLEADGVIGKKTLQALNLS